MEALRCIMPALTASSVAMAIGAVAWEVEWTAVLPEREGSLSWSVAGDGPWRSLAPVLFIAGAVLGSLLAGSETARFGNRIGMMKYDAILGAGLVVNSITPTFPEFVSSPILSYVAARLLLGIGSGGLCAMVPAYVGEVTHGKVRGRLGLLFPAIAAIGAMITAISEKIFDEDKQLTNIIFNACCMSIVVLHSLGLNFVSETSYFISNELFEQDPFVAGLMDDLQRTESLQILYKTNYGKALRRTSWRIVNAFAWRADRKAALIGIGSMFFHQMCGINMMNSYLTHVMKMSDVNVDPKTMAIVLEVVQVIMTGVAMAVIDQKGRRLLLLLSAVTMSLCLAGLTLCIFIEMQQSVKNILSMILATVFILAYHLGFGPVPWVIVGEIFSTNVKPYGISLSSAMNWLMVFARVYFPCVMFKFFDTEYIFLVYIVVCLLAAIFAWKIVPETKKSSLLQVQLEVDASFEDVSYIPV